MTRALRAPTEGAGKSACGLAAGLALMLGLLFAAGPAWAQGGMDARCTKGTDRACVDWTNGVAIAVGMGAPATYARTPAQKNITATRAARLDAARNLLELIKGVNISASSNVEAAMVASDSVRTDISGRLNGIREVERPRYFSDGSVQVKLEANLREVVPDQLYMDPQAGPPREIGAPVGSPTAGSLNPQTAYSGLIIDARGTGVQPALAPKVFDPQGREVYGSAYVSREFSTTQGMVGYAKTPEQAAQIDRVKGNPALIKAVEAQGANKADLVISQADADALRAMAQQQNFLREARVMILLD